jgi:hypothetical protein
MVAHLLPMLSAGVLLRRIGKACVSPIRESTIGDRSKVKPVTDETIEM